MAIGYTDKQQIVAEVNQAAGGAVSAALADYRGLTSGEMMTLRAQARANQVSLRVVRNTLAIRAVAGTPLECLRELFVGPSLLALSETELSAPARLLKGFAADHPQLEIRALVVGDALFGPEQLDTVSSLPTREEALAMLLGTMQAPVAKLAQVLNAVPTKLVATLDAVRDQKQQQGAA